VGQIEHSVSEKKLLEVFTYVRELSVDMTVDDHFRPSTIRHALPNFILHIVRPAMQERDTLVNGMFEVERRVNDADMWVFGETEAVSSKRPRERKVMFGENTP
jgi:hypothetical protein